MSEGRRQPTPNPSQEGRGRQETGDRRNGYERGGRSKNCKNDFSTQLLPKILTF
ncbi:MAG: hypothetical protein F6K48_13785 [Okeania sp. SIO3H1]|nr:hypothetical protein [Okeania sp. SIO3H1]